MVLLHLCTAKPFRMLRKLNIINITLIFFWLQGQLTEDVDVLDYLMEQPNVVPRMNPLILNTEHQYLDFTSNPGELSY